VPTSKQGFNPDYTENPPTLDQVSSLTGSAILEFGAPWCEHCQAAKSAVKEVMDENPTLTHIKVYDGKGKRLGRAFNVKLWPTLILLKDGKEIDRLIRPLQSDEVRQLIAQSDALETS
jgi:thioredoxin 1